MPSRALKRAPRIDRANGQVAVALTADPQRRVYVRRINVAGNNRTRDEVVRREFRQFESAWYDGGKLPPAELFQGEKLITHDGGSLVIGSKATLFTRTWHGGENEKDWFVLLPRDRFADLKLPEPTLPRTRSHHQEWIDACRGLATTQAPFEYAAATMTCAARVALRSSTTVSVTATSGGNNSASTTSPLVDVVTISRADYSGGTLTVEAVSSDEVSPLPALTLVINGIPRSATWTNVGIVQTGTLGGLTLRVSFADDLGRLRAVEEAPARGERTLFHRLDHALGKREVISAELVDAKGRILDTLRHEPVVVAARERRQKEYRGPLSFETPVHYFAETRLRRLRELAMDTSFT